MDLAKIPVIGWVTLLILGLVVIGAVIAIIALLSKSVRGKNIQSKLFSITDDEHERAKRELAMTEGKDQLENQCDVAKNILKELRVKIYDCGIKKFNVTDIKDLTILRLITYNIIDMMNYAVKTDLTRNHITNKTASELDNYVKAKARGYYAQIKDNLYTFNSDLPDLDLPTIMEDVTLQFVEIIMKDVYYSARNIVGVC